MNFIWQNSLTVLFCITIPCAFTETDGESNNITSTIKTMTETAETMTIPSTPRTAGEAVGPGPDPYPTVPWHNLNNASLCLQAFTQFKGQYDWIANELTKYPSTFIS